MSSTSTSMSTATAGGPAHSATQTLYVIKSLLDGDVMTVLGGSTESGTPVQTDAEKVEGVKSQQWRLVAVEPGWWFVETAMDTGFVMSPNGDIPDDRPPICVASKRLDDLDDQLWSLVPTETLGYWYIQSKGPSVMDIADGGRDEDARVVGSPRRYDPYESQAWGFAPVRPR